MDFNAQSSHQHGCFCYHIFTSAMTLTFDLQNLIRSSVGASEYYMSVLSEVFKPFMRYCNNVSVEWSVTCACTYGHIPEHYLETCQRHILVWSPSTVKDQHLSTVHTEHTIMQLQPNLCNNISPFCCKVNRTFHIASVSRRSQHSQKCKDPCQQCFCDS